MSDSVFVVISRDPLDDAVYQYILKIYFWEEVRRSNSLDVTNVTDTVINREKASLWLLILLARGI